MKTTKYIFLLLLPLCLIFGYSASSQTIFIGQLELEKHEWVANIKDSLDEKYQNSEQIYAVSSNISQDTNLNESNKTQSISTSLTSTQISQEITNQINTSTNVADINNSNTSSKKVKNTIMVIGDSMAQGLQPHFEKLAIENNSSIITRYKIGSSSFYWSNDKQIKDDIIKLHPNMVLIVLGSNEWLGSSNPKLKRAIKKLVNDIHLTNTPYIWIGPPIKNAEEYQQMLCDVANPKYVYDYTDLNVTRGKDKIHPTPKGFSQWSKMILSKLSQEELIVRN